MCFIEGAVFQLTRGAKSYCHAIEYTRKFDCKITPLDIKPESV